MNDFEDRLSSALRSAGDDAPDAAGLAPAARGRARARTRRTALTAVAAVVAVGGVIGGVIGGAALLGDRDGGRSATPSTDGATDTASTSPDTPVTNSRVESWRDLSVTVPADWRHGSLDDWCADGGNLGQPVVERPGGASVDILCDPASGYGVRFFDGALADLVYQPGVVWRYEPGDGAPQFPVDSWLGYQRSRDNIVWVVTPDRQTAEQVLATFAHNTAADANGCAPHAGDPGPSVADGSVRLCRYGIDDWLEQSEVLSGQDAADALAALESAPARGDRMCTMELSGPRIRVTTSDADGWVTLNACQGFSWVGGEHDLTADVLYWVLSPGWSGGVEGEVPMPEKLRQ